MKLLTVDQVAEMLSCATSTVYEMVSRGDIPGYKIGPRKGGIRIDEADVEAYVATCRIQTEERPRKMPRRIKSRHFSLSQND